MNVRLFSGTELSQRSIAGSFRFFSKLVVLAALLCLISGPTLAQGDNDNETGIIPLEHARIIIEFNATDEDVDVPASVTSVTVPPEFLEPDTEYDFEVLAIEESGNQTISESSFTTAR